jgi:hypothetical protein
MALELVVELTVEIGPGEAPMWWAKVNRFHMGNSAYTVAVSDFAPLAALGKLHDELDEICRGQEPPMPDTGPIPMPAP